jgi:molybdopterin molybdotransferase
MAAAPRRNVTPAELGQALAEALPGPRAPESVPLAEAAGRVPAHDRTAPYALPPVPTARVDGYAVAGAAPGGVLAVTGRAFPGDPVPDPLEDGETCLVMTGAPLPPGAAGVVRREDADEGGPDGVRLGGAAPVPSLAPGAWGAEGDVLARAGAPLTAVDVGRLATFGLGVLDAFPRPRVDLIAVGSELRDPADPADPGPPGALPPHYNGNAYVLAALVRSAGGLPRILPPAPDDLDALAAALAGSDADLIVTTGGTARGDHDRTAEAARAAGFSDVIEGVAARPGHTARVALQGHRVLVVLPGSPGAMTPLFALLVGPVLRRLGGVADFGPHWREARLGAAVAEPRPQDVLPHAVLKLEDGTFTASPRRDPGNGFALLPAGDGPLPAGTLVSVLWGEGVPG